MDRYMDSFNLVSKAYTTKLTREQGRMQPGMIFNIIFYLLKNVKKSFWRSIISYLHHNMLHHKRKGFNLSTFRSCMKTLPYYQLQLSIHKALFISLNKCCVKYQSLYRLLVKSRSEYANIKQHRRLENKDTISMTFKCQLSVFLLFLVLEFR